MYNQTSTYCFRFFIQPGRVVDLIDISLKSKSNQIKPKSNPNPIQSKSNPSKSNHKICSNYQKFGFTSPLLVYYHQYEIYPYTDV